MFQVRVWETAFGSYDNARDHGADGKSGIIRIDTGDPTTNPPGTAASLKGISGITVGALRDCVPEPSVFGLGLLGAVVIAFLRATKRNS